LSEANPHGGENLNGMNSRMRRLQAWVRKIDGELAVLTLALRHPCTPWYARAVGALTLLYALSPIDLIPDFIPVLGLLDDLILVPIGLWITFRLIPRDVWQACAARAAGAEPPPKDPRGAIVVLSIWLLTLLAAFFWVYRRYQSI
jgi:uncharacterized membrane protein YkvA (DUF1232 family)